MSRVFGVGSPSVTYSFDNDDAEAGDRHNYLSTVCDEFTFARLTTLGSLTGQRCLELGAGGGSVARWLAERAGHVLATDINPRHVPAGAGYDVLRHDLVTDPVPTPPWHLIHARMVLLHIPERREILPRLAAALEPGGALVIEDWDTSFGKLVLDAPDAATADLVNDYQDTLIQTIMPSRGNDPGWATEVGAAMRAAGLVDVDTEIHARSWRGGTAGAMLIEVNTRQLWADFLNVGWTEERLNALCQAVADPRLVVRGHFAYSTIGYRPA
jgi:SAM-dependent methyltransferase